MVSPAQTPTTTTLYSGTHGSIEQQKKFKGKIKCQVSGCSHLVEDKAYYRKYKICYFHSSQLSIEVNGALVRWCQQCGRFQALADFEGDRKTCKEKLDLHNSRRRRARNRLEGGGSGSIVQESEKQRSHQTLSSTQVLSCSLGPAIRFGRGPGSAQVRTTANGHGPWESVASPVSRETLDNPSGRQELAEHYDSTFLLREAGVGGLIRPSCEQLQLLQPGSPSQQTATRVHVSCGSNLESGQRLLQLIAQNLQRQQVPQMQPLQRVQGILGFAPPQDSHHDPNAAQMQDVPHLQTLLDNLAEAAATASGLPLLQMAQGCPSNAQLPTNINFGPALDANRGISQLLQALPGGAAQLATLLSMVQSQDTKPAGQAVSEQLHSAFGGQNDYQSELQQFLLWLSQCSQGGQVQQMDHLADARFSRQAQGIHEEAWPMNALASLPSLPANVSTDGMQQAVPSEPQLPPPQLGQLAALVAQLQHCLTDTSWQGQGTSYQPGAEGLAHLLTAQRSYHDVANSPVQRSRPPQVASAVNSLLEQEHQLHQEQQSGPPLARSFWTAFTSAAQQHPAVQEDWQDAWEAQKYQLAGVENASRRPGVAQACSADEGCAGTVAEIPLSLHDAAQQGSKAAEKQSKREETMEGMADLQFCESPNSDHPSGQALLGSDKEAFLEEASLLLFKTQSRNLSPAVYEALCRLAKVAGNT